jgi:glycerophosphoryl diester phosphodiesterase
MATASKPWPLPLWIAHRGAGKLAPENTLAAFRVGASYGYRAFECDVKLSQDGVPFLLHDDTLDRTSDAKDVAGQKPWTELSQVDAGTWHSKNFSGEPLANLAAIAHYVQNNDFALNLEIKPTTGVELATGQAVGTACLGLWKSKSRALLFSSFKPEALRGAKQTAAEIPRALLLDKLWPGWWDVAQDLGCVAVVTNYKLMDAALVAQLHEASLRAVCYTVNDPSEAQRLLQLGIDGMITDAVDLFAPDSKSLAS